MESKAEQSHAQEAQIKQCYGKYPGKLDRCRECPYTDYCRGAQEANRLSGKVPFEKVQHAIHEKMHEEPEDEYEDLASTYEGIQIIKEHSKIINHAKWPILHYLEQEKKLNSDELEHASSLITTFGADVIDIAISKNKSTLTRNNARTIMETVRILVELKTEEPLAYGIFIAKLDHPAWSYSKIAYLHGCDKQLVDYHLKQVMKKIPIFKSAILIDQRFNKKTGGQNARQGNQD